MKSWGSRVRGAAQREQQAKELISVARSRSQEFDSLVKDAGYDPPRARETHERAMLLAENAASALEAGELNKAHELSRRASSDAMQAERLVTELREQDATVRGQLRTTEQQLSLLKRESREAAYNVSEVLPRLETVELESKSVEELLRKNTPDEAAKRLSLAQYSLSLAERDLSHARSMHKFYRTTLPGIIAGLLGLTLLIWLFTLRSRSARRANEAQEMIEHWETLLSRVADNLLKFEDQHAVILGRADLVQRFDGATAQPVREAAHEVDGVFLAYQSAQRVLAEAKRALSEGGRLLWLREAPFARAIARLSLDSVLVRTEDVTERKLFLPDRREVRMTPQELLIEMQAAWERAQRLVEQLEKSFREAWEELDRIKAELDALEVLKDRLAELDAPSALQPETSRLASQLTALFERGRRDPLGASEEAKTLAVALSTLLARTERLVQAVSQVKDEVLPRRTEASATVARLRGQGLAVEEPGFEPEVMLAHINRTGMAAVKAVHAGNDVEAVRASAEAAASAAELLELCERTRRSREESPGHISEGEGRIRALRERLPERRERIASLRQAHADSALQPALDNADEATGILDQAAQHLGSARECVAPGTQRYLAGAELIGRAFQLVEQVDALYLEIETKADALAQARMEAEKLLAEATRAFSELQGMMQSDAFASTATVSANQRTGAELPELRKLMEAARPDWLQLREQAQGLASSARSALEGAIAEKDAWEKARALQEQLATRREAYRGVLAKSSDDREATNALFHTASQELDEAVAMTRQSRPSWPLILVAMQRASENLENVNQMAQRDFTEAKQARNALAAVEGAIRAADTHYGNGITAQLGDARSGQTRASALLAERNYAEALRVAEAAQKKAREAALAASIKAAEYAEARARRQREEARRSSSSSSWSSSSSRSSFSSSSSSFGSSSGRSSFSSSAGRSKW